MIIQDLIDDPGRIAQLQRPLALCRCGCERPLFRVDGESVSTPTGRWNADCYFGGVGEADDAPVLGSRAARRR